MCLCVWVCVCVSLPFFFLEALKDVVVCSGVCEVCVRACVSLQQSEEKPARCLFVFLVRVTQAVNAILVRSAGGDEATSLSCPSSSPCLRQLPVQPQSDESTLDVNVVSTRDAEVRIDQVNVDVSSISSGDETMSEDGDGSSERLICVLGSAGWAESRAAHSAEESDLGFFSGRRWCF